MIIDNTTTNAKIYSTMTASNTRAAIRKLDAMGHNLSLEPSMYINAENKALLVDLKRLIATIEFDLTSIDQNLDSEAESGQQIRIV